MDEFRKCPYCGEEIRAAATRCRYCRSRLTALDPERWFRDHPERRVAGVASAVARALAVPVGAVRLGFIVLTFIHLLGPMLYVALWLLVPFAPGGDAPVTHVLAWLRDGFERARRALDDLLRHHPRDGGDARRRDGDDHEDGSTAGPRATTLPLQRMSS
jgi:phage shock protein PspC (stress-responsive transcriptional regulator)